MLDIALFRDNPDAVRAGLSARGANVEAVDHVLALDEKRRALLADAEAKRARRNEISKLIPQLAKERQPIDALKDESRHIGDVIAAVDERLAHVEDELTAALLMIPNLPHESVPVGTEKENKILRTWGEPKQLPFQARGHWEIGESLGILDIARGTKISGSGYFVLKGLGAKLERTLISWMLDYHTTHHGYTEVQPPHLVTRKTMTGTGQLPKFEEDLYKIPGDDIFLIPTAEVPVTNLLADEILEAEDLPIRYCAYTPCFRREAGGYGKETRGISRVHQFDKVEMVMFEKPENSYAAHEELVRHATTLLEALNIPYRVVLLASGDQGFSAAKCHDIEIWAPGMNAWLEVSSCSNFEAYQARRAKIRFRREKGGRTEFVHTLNGSGLALPRLLIALLENNQQSDGSVELPPVIADRMGIAAIRA